SGSCAWNRPPNIGLNSSEPLGCRYAVRNDVPNGRPDRTSLRCSSTSSPRTNNRRSGTPTTSSVDARNNAPFINDAMPGRKSVPSSDVARFHVSPRRNGNASFSGASMFATTGDTSARLRRCASSNSTRNTFSSAGLPSSSANHTHSAPIASACNIPNAKPPAPPRLWCDGTYVNGKPHSATTSRAGLSGPLSTTTRWSTGRVCAAMTFNDSARSSRRCRVTTTATTASSGKGFASTSGTARRRTLLEALQRLRAHVLERVPALVGGEHLPQRTLHLHPPLVHPDRRGAQLQQQIVLVGGEHQQARPLDEVHEPVA